MCESVPCSWYIGVESASEPNDLSSDTAFGQLVITVLAYTVAQLFRFILVCLNMNNKMYSVL